MDGISAAASLIAIGQAIAALPKVVQALKSVIKFRAEVAYLINELESLRAFVYEITECIGLFTASDTPDRLAVPEPAPLKQCRRTLINIVSELEVLVEECAGETRVPRLRRLKWVFKSKKVNALVARTRETREDMMQACQLMGLHITRAQGNILLEVISMQAELPRTIENSHRIEIENLNHIYANEPQHMRANIPKDQPRSPTEEMIQSDDDHVTRLRVSDLSIAESVELSADDGNAAFLHIQTSVPATRICSTSCRCQCHAKRGMFTSPSWLNPLIGSLFFSYDCLPMPGRRKCDVRECSGSPSSLSLDYYFPQWLCSRAISLQASNCSIFGDGATLYLRLPRIIPSRDSCWENLSWNRVRRFQRILSRERILPFDRDEYGNTLLSDAISYGVYDIVYVLSKEWQLDRPGAKCDRLASLWARFQLKTCANDSNDLKPQVTSMLRKISLLNDEPDTEDLELHHAIKAGSDIEHMLKHNLINLNCFDIYSRNALHMASEEGNLEALRLFIQAGARLNDKDFQGQTPLVVSVRNGNFDCANALIEAGCDLSITDINGRSVLDAIMVRDLTSSLEMLILILSKVHVPSFKGMYGRSPLHLVPVLRGPVELMEEVVKFMIEAGADLQDRDDYGYTPILMAFLDNDAIALHLLLNHGAKLDATSNMYGNSILHLIAKYCGIEILEYLADAIFDDINPDARNYNNMSPLDCWRWRMCEDEAWLSPCMRRPTTEESDLFERLLRRLRDQNVKADIEILMEALQEVKSRNATRVGLVLRPLREQKLAQKKEGDAETLRIIVDVQVAEGMWLAAEEILEEMIDLRSKRMALSPFEERSNHYLPNDPHRYDTDEMEELSSDGDDDPVSGSDSETDETETAK